MSWRKAIATIKENITNTSTSKSWRQDLLDIAKSQGNNTNSWRKAVILWAVEWGIFTNSWRNALIQLALLMGSVKTLSWRNAIIFIASNFIEIPPVEDLPELPDGLFFLKAQDGIITNENNFIVVRG